VVGKRVGFVHLLAKEDRHNTLLLNFVPFCTRKRFLQRRTWKKTYSLADLNWLTDLMLFADFTAVYNELNRKIEARYHVVETVFENIETFEEN
jgi:hypothetical protein